jgi:tetratricopeptide (TPR) repeat protein
VTDTRPESSWEARVAQLWATIDAYDADSFIARIDALADELPPQSADGLFERGSAQDSFGHSDRAVPLYRAALEAGLSGSRRRQAIIQMASSLRNLGEAHESAALLRQELDASSDELDAAVRAFLALALVDLGREREAVATSLAALAPYLPRYSRSVARYAAHLGAADAPH